jgi:hypothetical protein
MQPTIPTSFARFAADSISNQVIDASVGILCAGGYYLFTHKGAENVPNLWRNTTVAYTIGSLASLGVRLVLNTRNNP